MKKKILCLLLILIMPLCFIFSGCGSDDYNDTTVYVYEGITFVRITNKGYVYGGLKDADIYVHKETRVMYIGRMDNGYFSILLNSDGTPMLWEGEL